MCPRKETAAAYIPVLMMPGLALAGPSVRLSVVPDDRPPGPGWSRKGVDFWLHCFDDAPKPVGCRAQKIVSPDGRKAIEIVYRQRDGDRHALLRILEPGKPVRTIDPDRVAPPDMADGPTAEVIWSPDSNAFLLNGHAAGYWGFFVQVFSLADPKLRPENPTRSAALELSKNLQPWCRRPATDNQKDCGPVLRAANFNMSAVDWLPDSTGIAVFGEVPSSSSQGIIMGQSRGYEIGVLGHYFLRAMPIAEFKARWQASATWRIVPPDALGKLQERKVGK